MTDPVMIWATIVAIGVGTFLLRFSFLGMIGGRDLPPWALRLLRYTSVAVMPGLVAPLVLWPAATGGTTDPARMAAALATLLIGVTTRSMLGAIFGGAVVLYAVQFALG